MIVIKKIVSDTEIFRRFHHNIDILGKFKSICVQTLKYPNKMKQFQSVLLKWLLMKGCAPVQYVPNVLHHYCEIWSHKRNP